MVSEKSRSEGAKNFTTRETEKGFEGSSGERQKIRRLEG